MRGGGRLVFFAIILMIISIPLFLFVEERWSYARLEEYTREHDIAQDISVSYVKGIGIKLNSTGDPALYRVCLPGDLKDKENMRVNFSRFHTLSIGGQRFRSGESIGKVVRGHESEPLTMQIYAPGGELLYDGWIEFLYLDDTPAMYISTSENAIDIVNNTESGEDKPHIDASVRIINGEGNQEAMADAKIFRHGNSTFDNYDPKSYNLTLDTAMPLLGMRAGRKWVLKSNAMDNTQIIRNELAFQASRMAKLEPCPDSEYINIYINGVYNGLYLMSQRVSPYELMGFEDGLGEALLEQDSRYKKEPVFFVADKKGIVVHYPESVPDEELESIIERYKEAISAIREGKNYGEYIDVESFVKMYVIQDFFVQADVDFSSLYFYIGEDGLFHAGPVWDFDLSCGYTSSGPYHRDLSVRSRLFDSPDRYCAILTDLSGDDAFLSQVHKYYLNSFKYDIERYMKNEWREQTEAISKSLNVNGEVMGIHETDKATLDSPDELGKWIIDRDGFLTSYYSDTIDYEETVFHFVWGSVAIATERGCPIGSLPDDEHEGNSESFWGEIKGFAGEDGMIIDDAYVVEKGMDLYAVYTDDSYAWEEYKLPISVGNQ